MLCMGIDTGTTSVSGVVYDTLTKKVCAQLTLPGSPYLECDAAFKKEQSADVLYDAVSKAAEELDVLCPGAECIAFSTQMHGFVYIDDKGFAVSPLYTWEDKRADEPLNEGDGASFSKVCTEKTGFTMAAGFGLATHFYNQYHGLVPENAVGMATAADYCAIRMSGQTHSFIHPSNAASWGLFDIKKNIFDKTSLAALEIDQKMLPVVGEGRKVGYDSKGRLVFQSIGDNQAGFLGTAVSTGDILINIGTSAQISRCLDVISENPEIETRPYLDGKYLLAGAALCGGNLLKKLNAFIRQIIKFGGKDISEAEVYRIMNEQAENAWRSGLVMNVDTRFCGTRTEPDIRGVISDLSLANLDAGAFFAGVYAGILKELRHYYELMPEKSEISGKLILTGNACRKNSVIPAMASEIFGIKACLSEYEEGAAVGAARFAAACMQ